MVREEYNLPLTKESYLHLREKADGVLISKTRYLLPLTGTDLTIELDVFDAPYEGLYLAEVGFGRSIRKRLCSSGMVWKGCNLFFRLSQQYAQ